MNDQKLDSNVNQKELSPKPGIPVLILIILAFLASCAGYVGASFLIAFRHGVLGGLLITLSSIVLIGSCICIAGLKAVGPNEALVLTLFGSYYGTILKTGFFFVNPFSISSNPEYRKAAARAEIKAKETNTIEITRAKKTVSMKALTLNNEKQKVNDILGNPVIIGAVVIWHVENPTMAVFNVDDYKEFLSIQTDSTIRSTAARYPYDSVELEEQLDDNEKTLRGNSEEIAESMKKELQKRVQVAGLLIEEVRIAHLSYAEEIASAMLQRQQATAIIAARQKIVDGAVGMVKMAIDKLGEEEVVVLDEERKAAMVSNLLVVLCSNKDTQPIVNSGSIY